MSSHFQSLSSIDFFPRAYKQLQVLPILKNIPSDLFHLKFLVLVSLGHYNKTEIRVPVWLGLGEGTLPGL